MILIKKKKQFDGFVSLLQVRETAHTYDVIIYMM